jgi:hypothetical protein
VGGRGRQKNAETPWCLVGLGRGERIVMDKGLYHLPRYRNEHQKMQSVLEQKERLENVIQASSRVVRAASQRATSLLHKKLAKGVITPSTRLVESI